MAKSWAVILRSPDKFEPIKFETRAERAFRETAARSLIPDFFSFSFFFIKGKMHFPLEKEITAVQYLFASNLRDVPRRARLQLFLRDFTWRFERRERASGLLFFRATPLTRDRTSANGSVISAGVADSNKIKESQKERAAPRFSFVLFLSFSLLHPTFLPFRSPRL